MNGHIETLRQGYVKLVEAQTLFTQAQEQAFTAKDAKAVTTSTRAINYNGQAVKSLEAVINRPESKLWPK